MHAASSLRRTLLRILLGLCLAGCEPASPPPTAPSVVLVTFDTTRADRLGVYGYGKPTSPHLDRLAASSVVYTRAYSVSSWTLPSHASLMTGLHARSHGADYAGDGALSLADAVPGQDHEALRVHPLASAVPTLAERLSDAGYDTAGVVAGPWLKRTFGLDRGFAHYDDANIPTRQGRRADDVTTAALAWLAARPVDAAGAPTRPFFLFLNYFDPHGPYADPEGRALGFLPDRGSLAPEGTPAWNLQHINAYYDGEIAYADHHFGRLLAWLRERGWTDHTWIAVTADHGELFGEHGRLGHAQALYEPEIRIPLIVRPPGGVAASRREPTPISLVDVAPLLLDGLGLTPLAGAQGTPRPAADRPIHATLHDAYPDRLEEDWKAWIAEGYKLQWNAAGDHRLFDLSRDPREEEDLAARQPERVAELSRALERFEAALPEAPTGGTPTPVDADTVRALRSLGYLGGEGAGDASPAAP